MILSEEFDFLFKLVLTGDSSVGKSNILTRFINNNFIQDQKTTIGVEFCTKNMIIDNKVIKIQIWDTAGQERYRAITHAYYKGAHGCLLVYDITNQESFDNAENWLSELRQNADENIVIMVVGNKLDLEDDRQISTDQVKYFAEQQNIAFIETSALDSTNIEKAFNGIVMEIYNKMKNKKTQDKGKSQYKNIIGDQIKIEQKNTVIEEKKKCC